MLFLKNKKIKDMLGELGIIGGVRSYLLSLCSCAHSFGCKGIFIHEKGKNRINNNDNLLLFVFL